MSATRAADAKGGPGISVVIPNYNHTRYLSAAIESALHQTCPPLEVIVVDDGSTDECRAAVAEFGARVRYVYQENQGLAGARNTGLRLARGELVGLLDADDQWMPTFAASMLALASQDPEATVYYCAACAVDEGGAPLPQVFGRPVGEPAQLYETLLRANFLIPSTIVMRREPVLSAGMFDTTLTPSGCEDWDLWLRLLPGHRFIGRDEPLVLYRQHGGSLSANVSSMQRAARAVIEKNFGLDDDRCEAWSHDKRRAFGGLYRYTLVTAIQRGGDWPSATTSLTRALQVDPSLATDLSLFYDLALGSQPPGYRDAGPGVPFATNAQHVAALMQQALAPTAIDPSTAAAARATATHALGLVAYNTGHHAQAIHHLTQALRLRPSLWTDSVVVGDLVKSIARRCLGR